ncbi:MAG: nucleotide sugar dehydrogenase [Cyanobacteria bacterium J06638_22]
MTLNIAILGLGYVGTTTAACLVKEGHTVLGVDINPEKVEAIGQGRSPVVEPEVENLLRQGIEAGLVRSAAKIGADIDSLDLVIICVGTPSRADGKLDLTHLLEVTRQLGEALRKRNPNRPALLLVFRSTVPPGTMDRLVLPTLQQVTGEAPGKRWEVAFNPEFLRESTAVKDYFSPPKIVIGEREPGITKGLLGIYDTLDAPRFEVAFRAAEMVKFVDNSFHALKVAFANEIGRVCTERSIDAQAVTEMFLADTKLNISPTYLRPGGPFGGSCLPKDLSAMLALARENGLSLPVLSGVRESNMVHLAFITQSIKDRLPPPGPILQLGLSFKAGTDDLRNSPLLDLAENLFEAGYDLKIYDPDLDPGRLVGVNFALAVEHRDTLSSRFDSDLSSALATAELIILGKEIPGVRAQLPENKPMVDVTRLEFH